ncbi:uncharacterized protein LOC115318893 [Ixodes scapularis]|uniref:uncharacterized protein LOC115318893 n=1 Tax=Ixodes scapularis TaxID=6945 RepID=UPI001C381025|nr:uncharacterized protein LOC115318893 [Ixodes scapularis]
MPWCQKICQFFTLQTKLTRRAGCNIDTLTSKLRECRGFIDFVVKPNSALSFSMPESCLGLQDYRTCVYAGVMEACGASANGLIKSVKVDFYINKVLHKHASVCSHKADTVPACNDEELAENLRRCKGIIRWLVFPSTENPDDESQEKLACMATIDYQKCVTKSARKVCPNVNIYSNENMDDLTQGLFTKFNSTCYKRKKKTTIAVSKNLTTVAPLKTPLCSEKSALKALMECMGFIHMKVIPNTVARGNPEMLKVACRSMKHYQHCVNQKIETCENSQVLESLMIKYYTGELYRKYEWTCQPVAPKAVCNPLLVLGHLENCSKELNHTIQGLNPEEANSLKLDKACMGVSAYHSCINSQVNVKCGNKLLPQTPHVLHYTRDLYNMYNWTCQPEHGDNCDGSEVLDSLTECLGFLNVLVIPYVQNSSKNASLETACSGYQEFKYCALLSVYGKCARRPYVLKLPRVQYFTHDLVQSYKWTCDAIHHGKASVCQTDVLLSQLKKCYDDHVKKHVLPNADIGGPSAKMQLACLALNRYQECVNEEVNTNCGNNQGQVLMLDAVKNYTYIVYEKFQWACDMHPDCNKNSLLNELTTCKGIINIKVVPNALNMSDNAKLREACRGIQFYQACVNEKMRLKCAMDSPVFLLPEVAYFTFVMFNKFNWTCFHQSQEGKYFA